MSARVLRRLQVANDRVASEVDAALMRALSGIDLSDPVAASAAVFEVVPPLVERWGDVAAVAAAEWFEEIRAVEGVPGAFRAVLADPVPLEQVNARLGYATRESGHLFAGNQAEFVDFLSLMVNEYTMQPGHDTVRENTVRDGAAYARVPEPGACDFCVMLGSRGFVYSKRTVGTDVGSKFHGGCRCHGMPVWDEGRARSVYGYDPDALYERYQQMR